MRGYAPVAVAAAIAAGAVVYGVQYQQRKPGPPPAQRLAVERTGSAERAGISKQARKEQNAVVREAGMVLPIAGLKPSEIQDTFYQSRGGGERIHEATDILSPRGTPVRAMVDGVIKKLFLSKPGGITVYEFDENGELCYYYAHLDRYAEGLHEGQKVKAGEVIGYVGTTGNADPNTPHLHLAFFRLNAEKQWWKGTPENPYPTLMKLVGQRAD